MPCDSCQNRITSDRLNLDCLIKEANVEIIDNRNKSVNACMIEVDEGFIYKDSIYTRVEADERIQMSVPNVDENSVIFAIRKGRTVPLNKFVGVVRIKTQLHLID